MHPCIIYHNIISRGSECIIISYIIISYHEGRSVCIFASYIIISYHEGWNASLYYVSLYHIMRVGMHHILYINACPSLGAFNYRLNWNLSPWSLKHLSCFLFKHWACVMSKLVIWKLTIDLPGTYTPHDVSMGGEISKKNITRSSIMDMILLPIRIIFNRYALRIISRDIILKFSQFSPLQYMKLGGGALKTNMHHIIRNGRERRSMNRFV